MTRRPLLGLLLLGLLLSSCGLENSLDGSLKEVYPLELSTVEVRRNDEALQVTYLRNRGVFVDVVARLSVSTRTEGVSADGGVPVVRIVPGAKIPLQGVDPLGARRAQVTYAPGGEPVRNLPEIERGDLVITEGGPIGQVLRGNFSVVFKSEGGDLGQGRTLFGSFTGQTLDAGFGELP